MGPGDPFADMPDLPPRRQAYPPPQPTLREDLRRPAVFVAGGALVGLLFTAALLGAFAETLYALATAAIGGGAGMLLHRLFFSSAETTDRPRRPSPGTASFPPPLG